MTLKAVDKILCDCRQSNCPHCNNPFIMGWEKEAADAANNLARWLHNHNHISTSESPVFQKREADGWVDASAIDYSKMLILHLVLTDKWYNRIESGRKGVEFREANPYWIKRISCKPFTHVRFQKGYRKNPPTMLFEIARIQRRCIKGHDFFAISLGCEVLWMPNKEADNG